MTEAEDAPHDDREGRPIHGTRNDVSGPGVGPGASFRRPCFAQAARQTGQSTTRRSGTGQLAFGKWDTASTSALLCEAGGADYLLTTLSSGARKERNQRIH
jgi:hypothetical protein